MLEKLSVSELIDLLVDTAFSYDNEQELDDEMEEIKKEILKRVK